MSSAIRDASLVGFEHFKRAFLIVCHLAFALACVMALLRLVAGRALDFEEESCFLAPVQNSVPPPLALASARLMALVVW